MLQTQFADQPILQQLIRDGYSAFAETILAERKLNDLPPFTYQCLFRAESTQRNSAMDFLEEVSAKLPPEPSVEMLGPIPQTMEKRAGRFRAQLLFSSRSRSLLHRLVKEGVAVAQASKRSNRIRWSLDIDPVDLV